MCVEWVSEFEYTSSCKCVRIRVSESGAPNEHHIRKLIISILLILMSNCTFKPTHIDCTTAAAAAAAAFKLTIKPFYFLFGVSFHILFQFILSWRLLMYYVCICYEFQLVWLSFFCNTTFGQPFSFALQLCEFQFRNKIE